MAFPPRPLENRKRTLGKRFRYNVLNVWESLQERSKRSSTTYLCIRIVHTYSIHSRERNCFPRSFVRLHVRRPLSAPTCCCNVSKRQVWRGLPDLYLCDANSQTIMLLFVTNSISHASLLKIIGEEASSGTISCRYVSAKKEIAKEEFIHKIKNHTWKKKIWKVNTELPYTAPWIH